MLQIFEPGVGKIFKKSKDNSDQMLTYFSCFINKFQLHQMQRGYRHSRKNYKKDYYW